MAGLLAACVAEPPVREVVAAPAPVMAPLYVYPDHGQSSQQLQRDRYECHLWAVKQTGFNPSAPGVPAGQRVVVRPATPPGAGTAVGAIAGAILGAAIAGPRSSGAGAIVGGITGAAIGSASDANAQAQADAEQAQLDRRYANAGASANNYRRAITACLNGRGYTVR